MGQETTVESRLAAFFEARFAPPLERSGIEVTAAARDLFVRTAMAQVEAGIVSAETIVTAVQNMDLRGLSDFYLLKFGPRPLSYNRMVRLLGDMHDKWIGGRHADVSTLGDATRTGQHARDVEEDRSLP